MRTIYTYSPSDLTGSTSFMTTLPRSVFLSVSTSISTVTLSNTATCTCLSPTGIDNAKFSASKV